MSTANANANANANAIATTSLFIPIKFRTHVQLTPSEMDLRFEQRLLHKLRNTYEGVCSRFGFIKPGSIQIIQRSIGQLMKPHFNGHIKFELNLLAEVCNPVDGMIVTAVVRNKNQLGILAESSVSIDGATISVLDIIIPKRTAGITSEILLDELQIGDGIHVEVLGKRYQLNDKKISIIGRGVPSTKPSTRHSHQWVEEDESGHASDDDDNEGLTENSDDDLDSDDDTDGLDKMKDVPFVGTHPFNLHLGEDGEEEEEVGDEDDEDDPDEDSDGENSDDGSDA